MRAASPIVRPRADHRTSYTGEFPHSLEGPPSTPLLRLIKDVDAGPVGMTGGRTAGESMSSPIIREQLFQAG